MPADLRVFVNARPWTLPAGAVVRDALRAAAPDLLPIIDRGEAVVTDGCGLPVALDQPLAAGAILRAAPSHRRTAGRDADD